MNSHTPGPWWVGSDDHAYVVYAADSQAVADTSRADGDCQAAAANARLIAAAPDLLEALIDACNCLQAAAEDHEGEERLFFADSAEKARAAIVRARKGGTRHG